MVSKGSAARTLQPFIRSRSAYIQARFFTQQPQLLRISRSPLRPQLPFLHTSPANNGIIQARLARLLTTERRKAWRYNFRLFIKFSILLAGIRLCIYAILIGIEQSKWERQYPEPPEFSFFSKWWYRTARGKTNPGDENLFIAWLDVGDAWKKLIARLEDPSIDGAGVKPRLGEGEELSVEGIGRTGLDITAKPETWRRGYYEALMGAAKTAEHLDTWVKDTTRNLAFPPDVVIGPSNPRPKPVAYGSEEAPKEENCEPAFEEPQTYYMRILTTEGFTSRQKLEAALAYADFLQFKGLTSSAGDMYEWALDIAVPMGFSDVIDKSTGMIADGVVGIPSNTIVAASALGAHKAQIGDLAAALSIFLSVLRAQRSLPAADPTSFAKATPARKPSTTWYGQINDLFVAPPYPEAPLSGEEPATRMPSTMCEEAATMAHIGEILYASSPQTTSGTKESSNVSREAGLAWTRDAFDLAEATIRSVASDGSQSGLLARPHPSEARLGDSAAEEEAKTRCVECLSMVTRNWKAMITSLEKEERKRNHDVQELNQAPKGVLSWLWSFVSSPPTPSHKWEREAIVVATREHEMHRLLRSEGLQMKEF